MIIVSACLVGVACRFDGNEKVNEALMALYQKGEVMPVCPEVLGGLPIPRPSCEIKMNLGEMRVISINGDDWTNEFALGAKKTLEIARVVGATKAIMKAKSPSCGCGKIYDGTFSKVQIDGNGIASELLIQNGIQVFTDENWKEMI